MNDTTQRELEEQVRDTADTAREQLTGERAHDIVSDIHFRVNYEGEKVGVYLQVAYGGPNIWVDTHHSIVEGWWWGSYASYPLPYGDWEAIQDFWTDGVSFNVR